MAVNDSTLADEDGEFSDWIEIRNPDVSSLSLAGYHLTDDATNLTKWTFPAVTIPPGGYLVVFASNKDRTDPGSQLHTNFRLTSSGEYLALVEPDGTTIAGEFAPMYPPQFPDESFGFGTPGASNQIDITPAWNSPGNYYNVKLNGIQSGALAATTVPGSIPTPGDFATSTTVGGFPGSTTSLGAGDFALESTTTMPTEGVATQIGDIGLVAIEVTQGLQNLDNDFPLLAGRPTWVRVHATVDN